MAPSPPRHAFRTVQIEERPGILRNVRQRPVAPLASRALAFPGKGAPERLAHVFEVPPLRRVVSLRVRTTQACWYRDTIVRSSLQTSLSRIICILMIPLDLMPGRRRPGVRPCSERRRGERPRCGRPRL